MISSLDGYLHVLLYGAYASMLTLPILIGLLVHVLRRLDTMQQKLDLINNALAKPISKWHPDPEPCRLCTDPTPHKWHHADGTPIYTVRNTT